MHALLISDTYTPADFPFIRHGAYLYLLVALFTEYLMHASAQPQHYELQAARFGNLKDACALPAGEWEHIPLDGRGRLQSEMAVPSSDPARSSYI